MCSLTTVSENATVWYWDFGDGNNSTEQNPLHTFSTAGTYTVNLTVSNANGTNSTSAIITVIAGSNENNTSPIGSINFTDRVVHVLDHTDSPVDGNWIIMQNLQKDRQILLPHPIKFTYSGPKSKEYKGVSGTLYVDKNDSYTITYPSSSQYLTLPIYLPNENVSMSFYGEQSLKGDVEIYLFNATLDSAHGILDSLKAGDTKNLDKLFHSNMDGKYKMYSATLGENGDLLNYDFGPLDAGQYCIVMIQKNKDNNLTVLSATAFAVAKYDITVSAPDRITKGEDLDIKMTLKDAPNLFNCTYGAVLIKDQAYKADIKINSDGTRKGTSVEINDIDVINKFGINSSNYRSKFTRGELQTEIQTLIGEGNGAISLGERGNKALSLTTFDLPEGKYHLFVGAYSPEKGLIGLTQRDIEIESEGSPVSVLPVADFVTSVDEGYAPLTVKFTDYSEHATSWSWDFDNDGNIDSTSRNPTYVYATPGTYTARLIVSNKDGHDSKSTTITVLAEPEPDPEPGVLPVADFKTNVSQGYVPLSVRFTDYSEHATELSWDFNNDGVIDSTDLNPVYVYTSPGIYTVSLIASNENGRAAKTATIKVLQVANSNIDSTSSSSGSHSSSNGGGGAGGSPEPQSNVEAKELSQTFVNNGKYVKFDFSKNATPLVYLSFDSKKTVGKTTSIVEMLKGKSTLVSGLPSNEVYKYLNIWVGNSGFATPNNIKNAVVCFKVEKIWVQDKGIDRSSITLNRYSDKKWEQLSTSLLKEDDKYMFFTAKTPGFSPFAITGKSTGTENNTQLRTSTQVDQKNENTAASVVKTSEQKNNASNPANESKKTHGFEIIWGITGLLGAVCVYQKRFEHK